MGGEHLVCGCYTGPASANNPALVAIRCADHYDGTAPAGHTLMRRDRKHAYPHIVRKRPLMAIPKSRRR